MKTLNRILAIAVVALLAAIPVATASAASVTMDYVAQAINPDIEGSNGLFGPYFDGDAMCQLSPTDGLVLDLSVADAWFTSEVAPQEMTSKQYAVLVVKTDDPAAIDGFTMKFGGVGKLWQDWVNHDGSSLPALTTSYQTICVDLYASGVDDPNQNISAPNNGADIAMNKGEASGGKIYLKTVTFQDEIPADAAVAGSSAPEPTDKTDDITLTDKKDDVEKPTSGLLGGNTEPTKDVTSTGDTNTGVEGMAIAMAVAAVALGGLVISKKVR